MKRSLCLEWVHLLRNCSNIRQSSIPMLNSSMKGFFFLNTLLVRLPWVIVLKAEGHRPKDARTLFNFTNLRCSELHPTDDISGALRGGTWPIPPRPTGVGPGQGRTSTNRWISGPRCIRKYCWILTSIPLSLQQALPTHLRALCREPCKEAALQVGQGPRSSQHQRSGATRQRFSPTRPEKRCRVTNPIIPSIACCEGNGSLSARVNQHLAVGTTLLWPLSQLCYRQPMSLPTQMEHVRSLPGLRLLLWGRMGHGTGGEPPYPLHCGCTWLQQPEQGSETEALITLKRSKSFSFLHNSNIQWACLIKTWLHIFFF